MTERSNKMATDGVRTIPKLLTVQSERSADGVAIVASRNSPLTYSRLRSYLDAVGKTLSRLDIGRNRRVAVAVPSRPEMAVALASIASFATWAPLNRSFRFDEFDFYLSDLKAGALIVQTGTGAPAIAPAQKHSIPVFGLRPAVDNPGGGSLTVTDSAPNQSPDFSRAEEHLLVNSKVKSRKSADKFWIPAPSVRAIISLN